MTLQHVLKHFSKTEVQEDERFSLAPMREREELLRELSELSNSGEGYISCAEHTEKVFSPFTTHFSQLCTPHPSPLPQGARENVSCAKHTEKNLFTYLPIHLFTFKKAAFTLAEVLITLGIIGVVAAVTLPTVISNVNERVNSSRQANIAYKVTQAMDKMKAMGLLNNTYASTDAFVDELQKHLKIAKRCDANHIADCWPTDKVMTGDGEEFEVKNAKTGKNLNIKSNTSNNVGLVLADGSSLILTYNQKSSPIDVGDVTKSEFKSLPVGFGQSKDFAYTTSNTASIDFVMDVNGRKGPNSETKDNKYHDIRSFKAARFAKGCAGTEVPGIGCVVDLGTSYSCLPMGSAEQKKWNPSWSEVEDGYTSNGGPTCAGGALKACSDIGMSVANAYSVFRSGMITPVYGGYYWDSVSGSLNFNQAIAPLVYGEGHSNEEHLGVFCVGN